MEAPDVFSEKLRKAPTSMLPARILALSLSAPPPLTQRQASSASQQIRHAQLAIRMLGFGGADARQSSVSVRAVFQFSIGASR